MTQVPAFSIVIPSIGRPSLARLLAALDAGDGPVPEAIVVVDDRPGDAALPLPETTLPITVRRSGGRGPAAARNTGWRATRTPWVCFLDDDVVPDADWRARVADDLAAADAEPAVAGSQGRIAVPAPAGRAATDDERRTLRLETARWITADMAYRRSALVACGGFDERFPRAYREDSDIALRVTRAGGRIVGGSRGCTHPVAAAAPTSVLGSVRAQRGNADDALLRRKFGPGWRDAIGEGRGRIRLHAATTAVALLGGLAGATGRRRTALAAAAGWLALTADFTARRIAGGPKTPREIAAMAASSALVPPVAVGHRLRGWWRFRHVPVDPPLAVLFDRDDTLIRDRPYLNDPAGVEPMPGARRALQRLRDAGLLLGVVTNQSGIAKGLITADQLAAVNARVDELLGPFGSWQVCVHDAGDGCDCRKPAPGMVLAAAEELGVPPQRCVVIGDIGRDVEAALAAGARAVLVPTERTLPEEVSLARKTAAVADSLVGAVDLVLRERR
ncbi:HAD-IIIA family hydrolase [Mycobacterium sp. MYCO198283]|uniref:HAD-IIIA family hydrolase n=1 Tax=Mycobacterium sp. MYCO198283 TaxID=2883505 RepID=UPI001E5F3023|nr:HAD-IIIA family hydrolase [Mycobacterium sp. MYCO198283]MCG5431677.1 HAD-IIIA family hydrolase [Mycobacterium sp. MYCO198283]